MALKDDCIAAYTAAQTEDTADWGLLQTAIDENIALFDTMVTDQAAENKQAAVIGNVVKIAMNKHNKKGGGGKKLDKDKFGTYRQKFEYQALQYLQTHFEAEGLVCSIEREKKLLVSGWAV